MKYIISPLVALALLSAPALANESTVYRSTGIHGEKRYTQLQPTDGSSFETLRFRNDGRRGAVPVNAGVNEYAQNPEQSRIMELEARIQDQEHAQQAQRCQQLRNNLANLNVGGRVYEVDGAGNRQFLSDQDINTKRERIQQAISQFCS